MTMTLPGPAPDSLLPGAMAAVHRCAGRWHGLDSIEQLSERLAADFQEEMERHRARRGGGLRLEAGASGELALYFAFFDMQKALLNWGACQGLARGNPGAFRQARFLASRVSWLKQASLSLPAVPPNAVRDYWDRLLSLGCDDWSCVHAQTALLPAQPREGSEFSSRLNRLLDAALAGGAPEVADLVDDYHLMKDLYGGALKALAGIACRDPILTRDGLALMAVGKDTTRALAWYDFRDMFCPAAAGIDRLAHVIMGEDFTGPVSGDVLVPQCPPPVEQAAALGLLDRIAPGLSRIAADMPPYTEIFPQYFRAYRLGEETGALIVDR